MSRAVVPGTMDLVYASLVADTSREVLRDLLRSLVLEVCAWSVGLGDRPHLEVRSGRVHQSGLTLAMRSEAGLHLGVSEGDSLALGVAAPGSFRDALDALDVSRARHADRLELEVLSPFALSVAVEAVRRVSSSHPGLLEELMWEAGVEDEDDLVSLVRAYEWEVPLQLELSTLVLAALGDLPLADVEAEGLPLSVVRAAEATAREAAAPPPARLGEAELAGALFLAEVALSAEECSSAESVLSLLRSEGLEDEEIRAVVPLLPLDPALAEVVLALLSPG